MRRCLAALTLLLAAGALPAAAGPLAAGPLAAGPLAAGPLAAGPGAAAEQPPACGDAVIELAEGEELVERTLWFHGDGPVGNVDAALDREEWRHERLRMTAEPPTASTSRVLASNGTGGGNPVLPFNFLMGYWHHALPSAARIVCAAATVYATTHSGELPLLLWVDHFHRFDVEKWAATGHAAPGEVTAYTAAFGPLDVVAESQLLLELATAAPGATVLYDSTEHPSALTLVTVEPPPVSEPGDPPDPAAPEPCIDEEGRSTLERHDAWFATAEAKVGNLAAVDLDDYPTWRPEPPTGSFADGDGGMYVVTRQFDGQLGEHNPHTGATFRGTFTGCLDVLAIEMSVLRPPGVTFVNGASHVLRPRLLVDGVEVYRERAIVGPLLWTEPNPHDPHARVFRLAFTGLDEAIRASGGDPDATHAIELNLSPQFNQTDTTVYLYDSVEHPSSIVANLDAEALAADGYVMLRPNSPTGG